VRPLGKYLRPSKCLEKVGLCGLQENIYAAFKKIYAIYIMP